MEIKRIIHLLRKRILFLIAAMLLFGGAAYYLGLHQSPSYEANAMLSVGGYISAPNPVSADFRAGMELAQTYAVFAKTTEVLNAVITAADLPLSVSQLSKKIDVTVLPSAPILQITVHDTDRRTVALIANELAQQLIARSPSGVSSEYRERLLTVEEEISRLQVQLNDMRQQLDATYRSLQSPELLTQVEWEELSVQHGWLTGQVTLISANLAEYMNLAQSLELGTNSLKIIESAGEPEDAKNSSSYLLIGLGALVGTIVAVGGILLLDYFDDTFHVPADVERLLRLPVLAAIPRFGRRGSEASRLVAMHDSSGIAAEKYRTLRASLLASQSDQKKFTYIMTSADLQEGKSLTSANLAVTMARAGYHVLLIDVDFRRPKLHSIFQLENECGLSSLFDHCPPTGLLRYDDLAQNPELKNCIQTCAVPGLRVITTGKPLSNPAEWLGSEQMCNWFEALHTSEDVDVILFDTPPVLAVSDSVILASMLEVEVILVVRANRTHIPAVLDAKALFEKSGVPLRGIILNRVNKLDLGQHYSRYYSRTRQGRSLDNAGDPNLLVPARKNHHRNGAVRELESQD